MLELLQRRRICSNIKAHRFSRAFYYRKKGKRGEDEIDLILDFPSQNNRLVAIEFKVGPQREVENGFGNGCADLNVVDHDRFVVHSGEKPSWGLVFLG